MAEALGELKLSEPWVPLIANVSAAPVRDPDEIKRLLVEQVTGLVRWRECVLAMKEQGVHELIELGAGKVLTGLTKRIDKELTGQAIGAPAEIEAFLKTL
jgi:[acyl-carrier-protein] S-malonyltransferase